MTTSPAIPANVFAADSSPVVDPTYADPVFASANPAGSHTASVRPFGIGRTLADRFTQALVRRREARAQLAHEAMVRHALSSDHRMRAEFDAHFMGF